VEYAKPFLMSFCVSAIDAPKKAVNAPVQAIVGSRTNNDLMGSGGNDTMTGGTGSDRFIYNTNAAFTTSAIVWM
jgi:RTX calcium-binding nonapeptide repeat (4 copies)